VSGYIVAGPPSPPGDAYKEVELEREIKSNAVDIAIISET
jgi:hypothetical protein